MQETANMKPWFASLIYRYVYFKNWSSPAEMERTPAGLGDEAGKPGERTDRVRCKTDSGPDPCKRVPHRKKSCKSADQEPQHSGFAVISRGWAVTPRFAVQVGLGQPVTMRRLGNLVALDAQLVQFVHRQPFFKSSLFLCIG